MRKAAAKLVGVRRLKLIRAGAVQHGVLVDDRHVGNVVQCGGADVHADLLNRRLAKHSSAANKKGGPKTALFEANVAVIRGCPSKRSSIRNRLMKSR